MSWHGDGGLYLEAVYFDQRVENDIFFDLAGFSGYLQDDGESSSHGVELMADWALLDNLSLCQFCWGPGNLFTYRELEDLLRATTGWQATMWELMKVGERRLAETLDKLADDLEFG